MSLFRFFTVCQRLLPPLLALLLLCACGSKQTAIAVQPIEKGSSMEHSPEVFLVMYDADVGKQPLLDAVKKIKAEVVYDYKIITGMALRKPADLTLEATMDYFRKVKGVVSVEYDHVYRITDPVRPKLEVR